MAAYGSETMALRPLEYLHSQRLLLLKPQFLSISECQYWLGKAHQSPAVQAEVDTYQTGTSEEKLRRGQILNLPLSERQLLIQKLETLATEIQVFFRVQIQRCEQPHFLKYGPEDYFRPHRDYHDAEIYRERKVSLLILLNEDYDGGELVFFLRHKEAQRPLLGIPLKPPAGMLLAFDPRLLHEVRPIQTGSRYSIVTWLC